jgi:hypothetical protein
MALDKLVSVYHYTTRERYKEMREGHPSFEHHNPDTEKRIRSDEIKGLWPRSQFIPKGVKGMKRLPQLAYSKVTYALLSPEPQEWINSKEYPKALWALMQYLGDHGGEKINLLEANLLATDNAHVVDASHIMPFFYSDPNDAQTLELYRKRFESVVNLTDYLSNEILQQQFVLPEVIIRNPIPKNRIRRVWERKGSTVWRRGQELYEQVHKRCA